MGLDGVLEDLFDMLEVENEGREPGSYIGRRAASQRPRRGSGEV